MSTTTVPNLFRRWRTLLVYMACCLMLADSISAIAQQTLPPPEFPRAEQGLENELNGTPANAPLLPPPNPDQRTAAPEAVLPPPEPPVQRSAETEGAVQSVPAPDSEMAAILSRLDALEK